MPAWAAVELAAAKLPDRRYLAALVGIVENLAARGGASFSEACGAAARQSARRLFGRQEASVEGLLSGHFQQTGARCTGQALVLCIQDTVALDYGTHRATTGLGPISVDESSLGLLAHSVLVCTPEGEPLGLAGLQVWARDREDFGHKHRRRQRPVQDKESGKWLRGLQAAQRCVPVGVRVLCVQDRESDVFAFFAAPRRANVELLLRATQPRRVELLQGKAGQSEPERTDLLSAAASAPVVGCMSVQVARKPGQAEREAVLEVRARAVRVLVPVHVPRGELPEGEGYQPQTLWVIQAHETQPPDGVEAIQWVLLTSVGLGQGLQTGEDACQMVRYYALRWLIERLHYVLKSGLRVEHVQIDDGSRLIKALALYYLAAWRLLQMTYLARARPQAPASTVLAQEEIQVLQAAVGRPVLSVEDAVVQVAKLGGYEAWRGAPLPGPKVLWRGLLRLEAMAAGWILAHGRYPLRM